jgi:hypothetical protein
MSAQPEIRVSDAERQSAVDRLRGAHDEGRLDLLEYDRRLLLAYQAVTNRDLDQLFVDLPATAAVVPAPAPDVRQALDAAVARQMARRPVLPGLPMVLRILWINYAVVVVINLAVWLALNIGSPEPDHFWPVWMLVPGIVLAGATAGVNAVRRNRPAR